MDLENATSYIQTNGTGMVGLVNLSSTSSQSSGVIETMSSTTRPALDQLSSTISSVNSSGTNRTTLNPLTEMFSSSTPTLVNSSSAGTPATSTVSFNQGSISTLSSISNTLFTDSENLTSGFFSSVPDMLSSTGFEYTHDFTSISSMANGTMTAKYLVQKDILNEFCLGEPFWDDNLINVDVPTFSTCFTDTALSLGACAYLWMLAPFFILYMYLDKKYTPLPVSRLNTAKAVVCFLLECTIILQLIFQEHYGFRCEPGRVVPPSSYTASAVKFATFLFAIAVQQIQRVKGVKTSAVPFTFWLVLLVCEVIPVYSHSQTKIVCAENVTFYIYFGLVFLQLILHCFAEQHSRQGYQEIQYDNVCPDENASVLNRILFHWLSSVVVKCYRGKFIATEFWEQTSRLRCDNLGPLLEDEWKKEIQKCEIEKRAKQKTNSRPRYESDAYWNDARNPRNGIAVESTPLIESGRFTVKLPKEIADEGLKPNLFKTITRCFWLVWCEATGYMVIGETTWLLQPIILRFIIQMIENKGLTDEPMWKGYMYAVILFLILCLNSFLYQIGIHHMTTVGLRVKTALICLIYKKALTMNKSGIKATTVGEVVNLMSVDCQRIQDGFTFSFYAVLIVVILIIATAQLWDLMGVASLGGLAVVLVVLPTVAFIATKQYKLQKELLRLKGIRIKILNEVISGIKVLKMYAWEPSFIRKIRAIRSKEIDCLWSYACYTATTVVFAIHSPFMINFFLVMIYVLTSPYHSLNAEQAFTALAIVNIIRFPIALCPFLVNGAVQGYVSVGRIQEFLWTSDLNKDNVSIEQKSENPVNIQNGEFTWNTEFEKSVLRNINLQVNDGELIAVVGPVGSGKSSLISACLGEMEKLSGQVSLRGKIAYVPQEAWIQNMTLRDNILFGKRHQEKKYRKVLDSCALLPDLEILAGGDMTEIGEKGINISGGQKQRVSLARAVYNNADVYFLDDPLSAVDSHVGKHLFKKVIGNEGLLKHKTRILVTHGVHWLPLVDRIVVLNDGIISEMGSYDELVSHDGPFAQFLLQYMLKEDEVDEEEDPEIRRLKESIRMKIDEVKSDGGMTSEDDVISASGRRIRRNTGRLSNAYTKGSSLQRQTSKTPLVLDTTRLTVDEVSEEGSIKATVLVTYMKAMGILTVIIVFITMSIFQGLNVFSNFWLTFWTEDELLKNISLSETPEFEEKYMYYMLMYLLFGVIQGVVVFLSFYMALTRMVRASGILHDSMLKSILHSPMSFFDTTPIGRMMNRFSSDIDIMDNKLPESFRLWSIMLFSTVAVIVVVAVITPIFMAAIVPIGIFYALFVKFYLPTARAMRRTESVNRSPIYNHFSETITGASVIRAYRCADRFIQESRKRVDENIKFFFASNTGSRWIGIRLELMGNLIALLATVFGLVSDELNGAQVGLSITYAVQITITLNLVVLAISEMEMNIVSAERVTEYTTLPSEAGWVLQKSKPPQDWPMTGSIEFKNYITRYREGLDLVLKGINCTINDGEKVGIVGRTGAGKSSLTLCLFRLIESAGGAIYIDGVNIAELGLHDVRSKITILPQDPVIFSGSLRSNLDPFCKYNDSNIWYALECAHLKEFVTALEDVLDYECGEGGQNLSVGQRQLVCLARTLLHKTRVLILDEATAAVDMETDDLIQDTIRSQFKECTILTVAHRLNTIMDYDRVMVLDAGLIKEFDSPQTLLNDTNGVFYGMAKDAKLV
ncbi:multidrug resistance-associated protein 1-like isoform X1 [Mya arenaria]|uniref:multidrug resistance-associated protein 1-like isoform X1 n=1 Tax=Mya arenaria TaxID=6604 RepID=UPI0022DFD62C|nr:multidrug resistance-associated protein 1-like isoform X1 [Mya arenaria]